MELKWWAYRHSDPSARLPYTLNFHSIDLHSVWGNFMFQDVSNCCGLPSPRKKMRFFAVFWLRFCSVSAFFRVRWAQAFQNLGSFSCSVHDNKQVWLVWKNVMVQVDTWQIQIYIILISLCCSHRATGWSFLRKISKETVNSCFFSRCHKIQDSCKNIQLEICL